MQDIGYKLAHKWTSLDLGNDKCLNSGKDLKNSILSLKILRSADDIT